LITLGKTIKLKLLIIFLLFGSCANRPKSIYGTWELGSKKGISQITINKDNTFLWKFNKNVIIDDSTFKVISSDSDKTEMLIKHQKSGEANKLAFKSIDENSALIINYKDHIDSNMVDEIMLAKKDISLPSHLERPLKQEILLPKNFAGEFFIVYNHHSKKSAHTIRIDQNGIGKNSSPDFIQLFNSNRLIRYSNSSKLIPIVNPNQYGLSFLSTNILSKFSDDKTVVIQLGFNQSIRENWITKTNYDLTNSINIEYFECLTVKEIREKYNL